jgi:hypothetical protein
MILPEYHAFEAECEPKEGEDTMRRDEQMGPSDGSAPQGAEQRRRLVSRRALVRAGWTVPVVLALNMLPVKAFATPGCLVHTDIAATAHVDSTVGGIHTDNPATLHTDTCV